MIKQIITILLIMVKSIGVAATSLVFALIPLTIFWFTDNKMQLSVDQLISIASLIWLSGHNIPLSLTLSPELLATYGLSSPAPVTFFISLGPLLLACFTFAYGLFLGRTSATNGLNIAAIIAAITGLSLSVIFVISPYANQIIQTDTTNNVFSTLAWYVSGIVVGYTAKKLFKYRSVKWPINISNTGQKHTLLKDTQKLLHSVWFMRIANNTKISFLIVFSFIVGLVSVSSVVLFISIATNSINYLKVVEKYNFNISGNVALLFLSLSLLPVAIVWALMLIIGNTINVGNEAAFSLSDSPNTKLFDLPLLEWLPNSGTHFGNYFILIPLFWLLICVFVILQQMNYKHAKAKDKGYLIPKFSLLDALITLVLSWLSIMVLIFGLAKLASGSIGPGRFSIIGPDLNYLIFPFSIYILIVFVAGLGLNYLFNNRKNKANNKVIPISNKISISEEELEPATVFLNTDEVIYNDDSNGYAKSSSSKAGVGNNKKVASHYDYFSDEELVGGDVTQESEELVGGASDKEASNSTEHDTIELTDKAKNTD